MYLFLPPSQCILTAPFFLFLLLYLYCLFWLPWKECKSEFLVETEGVLYASTAGKSLSEGELQLPLKSVTETAHLIYKY